MHLAMYLGPTSNVCEHLEGVYGVRGYFKFNGRVLAWSGLTHLRARAATGVTVERVEGDPMETPAAMQAVITVSKGGLFRTERIGEVMSATTYQKWDPVR